MITSIKSHVKGLMSDDLQLGLLVLRRASVWVRAGIIFVHVPKNGGTSINEALYGRFMGHSRVQDIARVRPDLLRNLPSIAVTRNPWARAYSAYNFARLGTAMSSGVQIWQPSRYTIPEFESFERFVLEWLPGRDLEREDYVFRSQAHFLLNKNGEVGVKHLGRIEQIQTYVPFLEQTLSRKIEVGHFNRTANSESYREAYSSDMKDTIARCYAADIERFDYDF